MTKLAIIKNLWYDNYNMLERDLEKLGLSSKEAKVYLATLELGQAAVQQIAKKAKLRRPTTYVILDSLLKMGLVTTVEEGKKTFYAAEAPEQLDIILKKQENSIEEKRVQLKGVIPDLRAIFNVSSEKPRVKFYEGKEGIIAMQEEFLRNADPKIEVVGFTPIDELFKVFPDWEETYTKRRINQNIKSRVIYTSKKGPKADSTNKMEKRRTRFVPYEKYPFTGGLTVYGNEKVALVSYAGQLMGVVIESKELAKTFRTLFELSWEGANKYNK